MINNIELYPIIPDSLIDCLERDFKNQLPTKEISSFELGRLIGRQDIIEKLKIEKQIAEEQ